MADWFPFLKQRAPNECAVACLRMLCAYYGKSALILEDSHKLLDEQGLNLEALMWFGEKAGIKCTPLLGSFSALKDKANLLLPCIAWWQKSHFVIVLKVDDQNVDIVDPLTGKQTMSYVEFVNAWCINTSLEGVLVSCKPI